MDCFFPSFVLNNSWTNHCQSHWQTRLHTKEWDWFSREWGNAQTSCNRKTGKYAVIVQENLFNHWNDYRPNYTPLVLLPLLVTLIITPIDSSLIRAKGGFKNITMLTTVLRKHQFSEPVSLVDIEFLPWLFIFFFEKIKKKEANQIKLKIPKFNMKRE